MIRKVITCFLCTMLSLTISTACDGVPEQPQQPLTAAELLDLGEKYLLELNYEQALVQFLAVIEIEPMNPRGYTGAAEAYLGLGREDDAITILNRGLQVLPNNIEISAMLNELQPQEVLNIPELDPEPYNAEDNMVDTISIGFLLGTWQGTSKITFDEGNRFTSSGIRKSPTEEWEYMLSGFYEYDSEDSLLIFTNDEFVYINGEQRTQAVILTSHYRVEIIDTNTIEMTLISILLMPSPVA